ncbi:hypothetical protein PHYBLDRAFT_66459 [Phycomyces blakesleeanus NRRL 1555(-)]|uniref:Uncharacterized protein n=1 Tax=Phycomyces blakesleeanus (strain ATCC 8743b / DSM 1359 / FGSC 10004 / NBRC 33097 / NRRL 1555) TaxID=763407 RepID=A0A162U032_PHYB8|nr:hypothetical protein PHYBLDRAFT_66459 [Phycomyces blakesleeanus NRRL 1555(-)]OAD71243.1 hypothetical protein PHYBLDRAFT_66459 [Phycomyces blakesleeanus NRRL 1555(-)]|eukprot:XP_018289283.1 hypothetical protein PHYBLDRAFT_66459 [Phycomyces blakesleeanus NRRL 1555(-)]
MQSLLMLTNTINQENQAFCTVFKLLGGRSLTHIKKIIYPRSYKKSWKFNPVVNLSRKKIVCSTISRLKYSSDQVNCIKLSKMHHQIIQPRSLPFHGSAKSTSRISTGSTISSNMNFIHWSKAVVSYIKKKVLAIPEWILQTILWHQYIYYRPPSASKKIFRKELRKHNSNNIAIQRNPALGVFSEKQHKAKLNPFQLGVTKILRC